MKKIYMLSFSILLLQESFAQTALTTVNTVDITSAAGASSTYTNAGNTYNWGVSPNNTQKRITGFSSAAGSFTYSNALNGVVKMRRINNSLVTGDYSLVWSEGNTTATPFNMQATLPATMEAYFDDNIFNKGTDNLFDNTTANSNNVERLDWIIAGGYSTTNITKVGFAVFERGADNSHDAFAIAAITGLDVSGNPNNYGTLKKLISTDWGDIASSSVSYRILKGASSSNLLSAGTGTQNRGGIFFSLNNLGITAGTTIYGYSIFANDVPAGSTSAQLSAVTSANSVTFPLNSNGSSGGIDLIATTGIFIENTILPIKLESFSVIQTDANNLSWKITDNNNELLNFEVQKSTDGINFKAIQNVLPLKLTNSYSFIDADNSMDYFYRIKLNTQDGKISYSTIVKANKSKYVASVLMPNPVLNDATVNFYTKKESQVVIFVYDMLGKKIVEKKIYAQNGTNTVKLNVLNNLKAGQYLLKIMKQDEQITLIPFVKK